MSETVTASPVKVLIQKGKQETVVELLPREITWTLKDPWTVGEEITLTSLAASVTAGPANAAVTAPKPAKLAKGGVSVTVTVEAPAAGGYAAASKSASVTVNKIATRIIWAPPPLPVLKDSVLTATQLSATITPAGPLPVFTPKLGAKMSTAGKQTLTASFPGNDAYAAATDVTVTLLVSKDAQEHASNLGGEMMRQGRGFDPPLTGKAKDALDNYNNSDPTDETSMRGLATKVMRDIQGKTGPELISYMDKLVNPTTNPDDKWVNDKTPSGLAKERPNIIWRLPNGMKVRYKPKGDGRDPTDAPQFMIEAMLDGETDLKKGQESIAFKITPDGVAAPKGPSDTVQPYNENTQSDLARRFMDAACATTHLLSVRKTQVITWTGDTSLFADADIDSSLFSVLGKPKVTVTLNGDEIDNSTLHTVGDAQTVRVETTWTEDYLAGDASFTIDITRRDPELTWDAPADYVRGTPLTEAHLNATAASDDLEIFYRNHENDEIAVGDVLVADNDDIDNWGGELPLTATTGQTGLYAAGKVADVMIKILDPPKQQKGKKK